MIFKAIFITKVLKFIISDTRFWHTRLPTAMATIMEEGNKAT